MNHFKLVVMTHGIKKKQQTSKQHSFIVANYAQIDDKERFKDAAKGIIESNMKTSNKAVLMAYKVHLKDDNYECERLPSLTWEL